MQLASNAMTMMMPGTSSFISADLCSSSVCFFGLDRFLALFLTRLCQFPLLLLCIFLCSSSPPSRLFRVSIVNLQTGILRQESTSLWRPVSIPLYLLLTLPKSVTFNILHISSFNTETHKFTLTKTPMRFCIASAVWRAIWAYDVTVHHSNGYARYHQSVIAIPLSFSYDRRILAILKHLAVKYLSNTYILIWTGLADPRTGLTKRPCVMKH